MASFDCFCCLETSSSFESIVKHLILNHKGQEIKLKKKEKNVLHTLNYRIIPEICQEQGRLITINFETEKIHLSKAGF